MKKNFFFFNRQFNQSFTMENFASLGEEGEMKGAEGHTSVNQFRSRENKQIRT